MAFSCTGVLKWTYGLAFLSFILVKHVTEGAKYGENCTLPSDCIGRSLTCSLTNSLCVCSEGYTHSSDDQDCQVSKYSDEDVFVPDFNFSSESKFETDMSADDLDPSRYQEIKEQLELELTLLFQHVTGFKSAKVDSINISYLLVARWTVRLNGEDPKFLGATPKEIGDIVRPELEAASKLYKDVVRIDTKRRARPMKRDPLNKMALGLGLGLGLAGVVITGVVIAVAVVLCRRKQPTQTAKSISDQSSSCESGLSSKMDPDHYQYNVFTKDGFSIPPHYAKFSPPSYTGSSSTVFMENSDKIPLHNPI